MGEQAKLCRKQWTEPALLKDFQLVQRWMTTDQKKTVIVLA